MTQEKKPKMGRPKVEINIELVKELCEIQCTGEEIASVLHVGYDTLCRRIKTEEGCTFKDFQKKHSEGGKSSLRRWQFKAAKEGSVPMLIWLGKQHLKQRDKPEDNEKTQLFEILAKVIDKCEPIKDKGEPTTSDKKEI